MKATQFIKDHGLERARHILSGLPVYYTHMTDDARMFVSEHNKDLEENIRKQLPKLIRLDDLNRLVESVDLVKEHYTIERATKYANSPYTAPEVKERLIIAIKDHESIYGDWHV